MKLILRAAAMAAAPIVLVATAALAASPPPAAQPAPIVLADHASASLDQVETGLNEPATAASAGQAPQAFAQTATAFLQHALGFDKARPEQPRPLTLDELVQAYADTEVADAEQECLAGAVYFEARGEPIEGQLAVAEVVLNRAASGKYPTSICGVVTQPWQFSFIRRGRFPSADRSCEAWRKAVAIARIASAGLANRLDSDVLWYHANYVSPSWGKRLNRETQIGLHIFYS